MTKLSEIIVPNGEGGTQTMYVRVWNNHLATEKAGQSYDWPKPAAFVEFITPVDFNQLGGGFRSADLGVRVHLIHEYYNQDGTFEQDLEVFDYRDKILAKLSLYEPTACGPLTGVSEQQDYDHDNLYHYIIDFACNFTDSKGSPYDPGAGKFIDKDPPTGIEIIANLETNIAGVSNQFVNHEYKIPK